MSVVDKLGRIWSLCTNLACEGFEHPEDLHAHMVGLFEVGEVINISNFVPQVKVVNLDPLTLQVVRTSSQWKEFTLGMLVQMVPVHGLRNTWNIAHPDNLPWFSLTIWDGSVGSKAPGEKTFEHYR